MYLLYEPLLMVVMWAESTVLTQAETCLLADLIQEGIRLDNGHVD